MTCKLVRDFSRRFEGVQRIRFSPEEYAAAEAAEWRCHYCFSDDSLVFDHIHPKSLGGSDDMSNLVPCCNFCNSAKRTMSYDGFLLKVAADKIAYETTFSMRDCQ
jgi:5-methylcytosine-specific restriction endonuclease McrA